MKFDMCRPKLIGGYVKFDMCRPKLIGGYVKFDMCRPKLTEVDRRVRDV